MRERSALESRIAGLKKEEDKLDVDGDWLTSQAKKLEVEKERRQLEEKLNKMDKQDAEIEEMKKRVKKKVLLHFKLAQHLFKIQLSLTN